MTRAVPADPVNPLTNARRSKHVGTYSLKWGSWEGTRKASTPAAFMAARRDASFESGAAGGNVDDGLGGGGRRSTDDGPRLGDGRRDGRDAERRERGGELTRAVALLMDSDGACGDGEAPKHRPVPAWGARDKMTIASGIKPQSWKRARAR